jgi:hypothetical protein
MTLLPFDLDTIGAMPVERCGMVSSLGQLFQ